MAGNPRAARAARPNASTALDNFPLWVELSKKSYERATVVENGVDVLIADHDGFRVIVPRGTSKPLDVLRDAWALPVYSDELDAWVHAGFLKCARIIAHRLWKHFDVNMPVFLDGHSLGGAVATVLAAFMARFGQKPAGLITQGCPRVGSRGLSRQLEGVPTRRLVMPGDVVTMVPVGPWFRHVGRPIRLPIKPPLLPGLGPHELCHYEAGARVAARVDSLKREMLWPN